MGLWAVGWDVNTVCVDGAHNNLLHAGVINKSTGGFLYLAKEDASLDVSVHRRQPLLGSCDGNVEESVACVLANLPWGKNANDYYGHNENIIKNVIRVLKKSKSERGKVAMFVVTAASTYSVVGLLEREMMRVDSVLSLGSSESIVITRS